MNFRSICFIICVMSYYLSFPFTVQGQERIPELVIPQCNTPPSIDGDLNDECWKNACSSEKFYSVSNPPGEIFSNTEAKITADNIWLYIGIICRHPAAEDMQTEAAKANISRDESVEIFIDPGNGGKLVCHYFLNSVNKKYEKIETSDANTKPISDIPWISAVKKGKDGWSAETAVPLYFLASYGDLDKLKLNICRNFTIRQYDNSGIFMDCARKFLSLSPISGFYMQPNKFMSAKGLEILKIKTPFIMSVSDIGTGGFQTGNDEKLYYNIDLTLSNLTGAEGTAKITVMDSPVEGSENVITEKISSKGTGSRKIQISVPVETASSRNVSLSLSDAVSGIEFQKAEMEDTSIFNIMSAYCNRSFYTNEKSAGIICKLGLPENNLKNKLLRIISDKKVLLEKKNLQKTTLMEPLLSEFKRGTNELEVCLINEKNLPICSQKIKILKLEPKPGYEWKIDRENGTFLRDGQSFFPFGMLIGELDENAFREIAEAGFNHLHWFTYNQSFSSTEKIPEIMKCAAKFNLNVILETTSFASGAKLESLKKYYSGSGLQRMQDFCLKDYRADLTHLKNFPGFGPLTKAARNEIYSEFFEKNRDKLKTAIDTARKYPNLMGQNIFEETSTYFDMYVQGRELYRMIKELDGYDPVFLLYSSNIPSGSEWTDWCDVLGTDPYWVTGGQGERASVNFVSKITCRTKERAMQGHQATWIMPMSGYWSRTHRRGILPEEQKCQTWLAIIHGANAISYFIYGTVPHQKEWEAFRDLSDKIKTVTPAITSPIPPQKVNYGKLTVDNERLQFPDVQVSLRKNPSGSYILLAANSKYYPADVSYKISGLNGNVRSIFENKEITVKNNSFSDKMEGMAIRAYEIGHLAEPEAAVSLSVEIRAYPEKYIQPSPTIPITGRIGKKNILPNPSFEDAELEQWPDYYRPMGKVSPRIGHRDSNWGLDGTISFEGKKSLKMRAPENGSSGFRCKLAPPLGKIEYYTFSIYLKADKDNVRCSMGMNSQTGKMNNIVIGKEWKRYQLTGKPGTDPLNEIIFSVRDNATVWADALQFEKGSEATGFEN